MEPCKKSDYKQKRQQSTYQEVEHKSLNRLIMVENKSCPLQDYNKERNNSRTSHKYSQWPRLFAFHGRLFKSTTINHLKIGIPYTELNAGLSSNTIIIPAAVYSRLLKNFHS